MNRPRMARKKIKRTSRGRKLTPKEAAKYRKIRQQIEVEKPEINARIRARLATKRAVQDAFAHLRELREEQGKSLADMRKLTGIDRSALSKLETGKRENLSIDTLMRYAQALGKKVVVSVVDDET